MNAALPDFPLLAVPGAVLWISLAAGLIALLGLVVGFLIWKVRGPNDTRLLALLRLLVLVYMRLIHGVRVSMKDPIPSSGAVLLVANHRSGLDPLLLGIYTHRLVRFLMAREYFEKPLLHWFCKLVGAIPVNRDGRDLSATKNAIKALRSGEAVGIFPEGGIRVERDRPPFDGNSEEEALKRGVALLALKTGAPVVPAFIEGTPSRDSVLASFLILSRSRATFGEPMRFRCAAEGNPTRDEIREVTREIFRGIEALRPAERQVETLA